MAKARPKSGSKSGDDNLTVIGDLTPPHLRCSYGGCPAVLALSDGDLLIIGKKLPADLSRQIEEKVAKDEFAVKINPEFFKKLRW